MPNVCAFTSICEEDKEWVPQYLAEVYRLGIHFAVHFDRCSLTTKEVMSSHPYCVGWTAQDDPAVEFNEQHKQAVLDLVAGMSRWTFGWALAWDVDETWEPDAQDKLKAIDCSDDLLLVRWVNLWEDDRTIRVDGPFKDSKRAKLYNLRRGRGLKWRFDHPITNGAKLVDRQDVPVSTTQSLYPLTCIHHGLKTRALRQLHKDRWDRIYSTALRGDPNPYGTWKYALDDVTYPPVTESLDAYIRRSV